MIGVTMMDAQAFVSAYRGEVHQLNRQIEYRRQAKENGFEVRRHRAARKQSTNRAKNI